MYVATDVYICNNTNYASYIYIHKHVARLLLILHIIHTLYITITDFEFTTGVGVRLGLKLDQVIWVKWVTLSWSSGSPG